jgi:hypothetical protein
MGCYGYNCSDNYWLYHRLRHSSTNYSDYWYHRGARVYDDINRGCGPRSKTGIHGFGTCCTGSGFSLMDGVT